MNKRYDVELRTASKEKYMFDRYVQNFPRITALDGQKRRLKWRISVTGRSDCIIKFPRIEEYINGNILISSGCVLHDVFLDNDPLSFSMTNREKEMILKMLKDGRNWEEFKSKYSGIMGEFVYGNEIAKAINQKTGIEVKYSFLNSHLFSTFFYSTFNSKEMSDDKMRTIKIVLNVIDAAFEEAWDFDKLYDFFTAHGYRERRKYPIYKGENEYRIPRYGAIRIIGSGKNETYLGLRDGRLLALKRAEALNGYL